jgi:tRNA threonylcarbamoyladenosine biosynthesis protein TsaE
VSRTRLVLADPLATEAVGRRLAGCVHGGMVIAVRGELGAGKTTLARGVLRGLGWQGPVKSPTYTLVEHYQFSSLYFYHFDFYRVHDPGEWDSAGFAECFRDDSVCLVEWPERVGDRLPVADLDLALAHASEAGRILDARAHGAAGLACLSALARTGQAS